MSVLDKTINNLMMRLQWCWSFGECGAPLHCHCIKQIKALLIKISQLDMWHYCYLEEISQYFYCPKTRNEEIKQKKMGFWNCHVTPQIRPLIIVNYLWKIFIVSLQHTYQPLRFSRLNLSVIFRIICLVCIFYQIFYLLSKEIKSRNRILI